jgi:DNA-binding SARP family transcriptional activator
MVWVHNMPPTLVLAAQRAAQRSLNVARRCSVLGAVLEFRVLGPFEVWRDGVRVELGGARRRAFLALLVLNAGRVLGRERLIDTLWSGRPPRTAEHVLHVYVSALRGLLVEDVLVSRPPGYMLDVPADAIDLTRFERLVAVAQAALADGACVSAGATLDDAAALWRGSVLEELAYEEFVQQEARRLEEVRVDASELRAEAGIRSGVDAALIASLRALTAENPLRERAHALLVRALAATGRQAEALAAYSAIRTRLDEELGIEPGPELRKAQLAVLRQEVAPVGTAGPADDGAAGTVLAVASDPERLAAVSAAADAVAEGSGREVIIACVLDTALRSELPHAAAAANAARANARSPARSAAFASGTPAVAIAALAAEHDVQLVVLDSGPIAANGRLSASVLAVLEGTTADVALLLGSPPTAGTPLATPFGGGSHDWAAIELAALIARGRGDGLRLIGAATDDDDGSRQVARAALALQRAIGLNAEPALAEPGVAGLIAAATGCGGLVIGLSDRWREEGLGALRGALADASDGVLVVRRGVRPGLLAPPDSRTRFTWSIAT